MSEDGLVDYDFLPSIFEHYRGCMRDPLSSLSPGNDNAQRFKGCTKNMNRSVVSVSAFIGAERIIDCSGIIIDWDSSHCRGTILTTTKVIRLNKSSIKRHYHLIVRLFNGELLEAKEDYVDCQINIVILKVISPQMLKAVELSCGKSFRDPLEISILYRIFLHFSLKQTNGALHNHPPRIGCDELLSSTCRISERSEGGPVIIDGGVIIGMNIVDDDGFAHLLPSESIFNSLLSRRLNREVVRLWFGLTVIDEVNLSIDARDILSISSDDENCVFVKQVYPDSPAEKAELRPGDRVISFCGSPVVSVEKFCQIKQDMSALASDGCIDQISKQLEIWRRADDKIVTIEAELLAVNDEKFYVCWPVANNIWVRGPLEGSQKCNIFSSRYPTAKAPKLDPVLDH